jgi:hypothetical protein
MTSTISGFHDLMHLQREMRTDFDDINYRINISTRYRYMYVEVPKAGCTTIKATLQAAEGRNIREILPAAIHAKENSPLMSPADSLSTFHDFFHSQTAFRFAFVRHPYSRLLSGYLEKINHRSTVGSGYNAHVHRQLGLPDDGAVSFEQFVRAVHKSAPEMLNGHWRPAHLLTAPNVIDYDFIGRFENFSSHLDELAERLGIASQTLSVGLEHATGASGLVRQYYTPTIQTMVDEVYSGDFEAFGYERHFELFG